MDGEAAAPVPRQGVLAPERPGATGAATFRQRRRQCDPGGDANPVAVCMDAGLLWDILLEVIILSAEPTIYAVQATLPYSIQNREICC